MTYQLRHQEMGIFQGSFLGLGFWLSISNMPEQGLFEFETREDIQEYLSFLCSDKSEQPLQAVDLFIEPFNQELNDVLVTLGINDVRKVPDEYLIRYIPLPSKITKAIDNELQARYESIKEELEPYANELPF